MVSQAESSRSAAILLFAFLLALNQLVLVHVHGSRTTIVSASTAIG